MSESGAEGLADLRERGRRCAERTSASQITEFLMCNRRWFAGYVMGRRPPPTEPMLIGTAIHAVVEHYLETGEVKDPKSDYGKRVLAARAYLPSPKDKGEEETLLVEQEISLPTFEGGPTLVGFIDHLDLRESDGVPFVGDVKCKSSLRYIKSPAELANDIQMGTYARWAMERTGKDVAKLRHVNIPYRGAAKCVPTDAIVTRFGVETGPWARAVAATKEMNFWAQAARDNPEPPTIHNLAPTTTACDKYPPEGCPYRGLCYGQSAGQRPRWRTSDSGPPAAEAKTMDQQQQQSHQNGSVPQQAQPTGTWQTCPTCRGAKMFATNDPGRFVYCSGCSGRGQVFVPDGTQQPEPLARQASMPPAPGYADQQQQQVQQVQQPPQQQFHQATQPGHVVAQPQAEWQQVAPPDSPPRTNPGQQVAERPPLEQPAQPGPSTSTRNKGKSRKAAEQQAAAEASQQAPQQAPQMAPAPVAPQMAPAPVGVGAAPQLARPTIYVDCLPAKGVHAGRGVHYEEWLAPITRGLAAHKGVADWRQIDFTAEGDLFVAISHCVAAGQLPDVILVSGRGRARAPFLEAVIPHAADVVNGIAP